MSLHTTSLITGSAVLYASLVLVVYSCLKAAARADRWADEREAQRIRGERDE